MCVPDIVRADELERLVSISTNLAAETRAAGSDGLKDVDGGTGVRMHVPAMLPTEIALCDTILQRMLRFVDAELPALGPYLFGTPTSASPPSHKLSLYALHESGDLAFSANEPAVNVYYEGGSFSPHKDYCALTVLIPLTSPDSFAGGGTGFWAPESRRGALPSSGEPSMVLAPPAGTGLLFCGDVMHAGMPVQAGTRAVFVASFDRR